MFNFPKKHIQVASLPHRQQGSTLIEVLVSMFILALGVMALLAMQLRTSASIKEAENITVVAQATQNLVEGMLSNPTLSYNASDSETIANYENYSTQCPESATVSELGASATKETLATYHFNKFCHTIQALQGVVADSIKANIIDASGVNNGKLVKVTWNMETPDDNEASGTQFSYELPLVR